MTMNTIKIYVKCINPTESLEIGKSYEVFGAVKPSDSSGYFSCHPSDKECVYITVWLGRGNYKVTAKSERFQIL